MEGLDVSSLFKPKKKLLAKAAVVAAVEEVVIVEMPELKAEPKEEEKKQTGWGCAEEVASVPEPVAAPKPATTGKYVPPGSRSDGFSATSKQTLTDRHMPTLAESMEKLEKTKSVPTAVKTKDAEEVARKEKEKDERKRQLQEELAKAACVTADKPKEAAASSGEIAAKYHGREKTGRKQMLVF